MRKRALAFLLALTFSGAPLAGPRDDIEGKLTAAVVQIQAHYVDPVDSRQVVISALRGLAPLAHAAGASHSNALDQAIRAQDKAAGVTPQVRILTEELMRFPDAERNAAVTTALNAMLTGLDAHSRFVAPVEFKPPPASIGLELKMEQGRLTVVRALPGGPAEAAGLRAGDVITTVDGQATEGMHLPQAVTLLRGELGTRTQLQVQRPGRSEPMAMNPERAPVPAPPALTWDTEARVAIVRITAFNTTTSADFRAALEAATEQAGAPIQGLVLDLRGNAGGLLDVAEHLGSLLLPPGTVIATLRGRSPLNERRLTARDGDILPGVQISVLVDGRTGAGAELVAAALQDHGRALLIGARTTGAGTIQTVLPLPRDESGMLLTSARMLRPTGTPIEQTGVTPDLLYDATTGVFAVREDLAAGFNTRIERRIQAAVARAESGADLPRVAAVAALGNARVRALSR
ncbi:S41 family peptidase [Pseudomonadota bacterium AL_CKDN230030165-1A_HGKHYDSX7]